MFRNHLLRFFVVVAALLVLTGCKSQEEIGAVPTPRPATATTTEVVYLHQDKEEETRTISVTGDGRVTVVAGHATVPIVLRVPVETEEEASGVYAEALREIYRSVSMYNVRPMDFSASGMRLEQMVEEDGKESSLCIVDDCIVTIRNVDAVADVVSALAEFGAECTGDAVYYFADLSDRYDEALVAAMEDAQRKAELLTTTYDLKLDDVFTLEEQPFERDLLFRTESEVAEVSIPAGVRVTYIVN